MLIFKIPSIFFYFIFFLIRKINSADEVLSTSFIGVNELLKRKEDINDFVKCKKDLSQLDLRQKVLSEG